MLREIFLPLIIASVAAGNNQIDFKDWIIDYSPQNVIFNGRSNTTLTYSNRNWPAGSGSRIHAVDGFTEGSYCTNLNLELASGTVFAFYVSSGEPLDRSVDKWDELDFEFPYPQTTQNHAWINAYHDGQDIPVPSIANVPNKLNAHYCITWNIGPKGNAIWSIDGVIIFSIPLDTWVKPLRPYISLWGASPGESAYGGFTGVNSMSNETVVEVSANNCYLSPVQEVFATSTPSTQPVTFLPTFIHGVCKSGTPCQGCQFCDSGELCPNACVSDAPPCPFCHAIPDPNPSQTPATSISAIGKITQAPSPPKVTVSTTPTGICPLYKNATVGCSLCQYCPDGSLCNTCLITTTNPTNSTSVNSKFASSSLPSMTPTHSTSSPTIQPYFTTSLAPLLSPFTVPTSTPSNKPSMARSTSTLKPATATRMPVTLATLSPLVQQYPTNAPISFVLSATSNPIATPTAAPTPLGTIRASVNLYRASGPLLSTGVLIGGIIGVIVVILVLSYTMLMRWGYRRQLSKNDTNEQVLTDNPKHHNNSESYSIHRRSTEMTHSTSAYDQEQHSASASASSVSGSLSDSHSATSHVDYFDHHSEVSFESAPRSKSTIRENSGCSLTRNQSSKLNHLDTHSNSYCHADARSSFDRPTDRLSLSRMGPPAPLLLCSLATSLHTPRSRRACNDRVRDSFSSPMREGLDHDIGIIPMIFERLSLRREGTLNGGHEGSVAQHKSSNLGSSMPKDSHLESPIPDGSLRSSTSNERFSNI